ncbi:GntR family transcriptional regulator [Reyranella soli]|jgi:GntR family transcriptional regulator|uniref:GntR family transcriptional regulator n=1 Tax=Reyranella soli TaxID=1230389 RepID=A0A512NGH0_9HYPH|nr:GntR family transcriptional regulator [Reyranella soli]GEP58049.1 GntR family transcriptional regulator [Reyranella soli]
MNRIAVAREMGSPLHHQIYLVLADGISTGRYAVGEALPTEEQLTRMFSVSRITVRRAMASLQDAGLIERGAGRRTVVKPQIGQAMRMPMSSVIENIVAYGTETVAKVLEFGYVEARGFAREKLWQGDRPVQRAVRVRSQNGVPVMHLVSYVPEALGRTFTADELNRIPLYKLLARAGVKIAGAQQLVSASLAEPLVASRLGVKVGAALIDLRSLMLDRDGRAVEYVEMLAVPEHLKLRYDMQPEQFQSSSSSGPRASRAPHERAGRARSGRK